MLNALIQAITTTKYYFQSVFSLPGFPSAKAMLFLCLDLPGFKKFRRDIILSSALPALKGGLMEADADLGRRVGDNDLDLRVTLSLFSGRRGHSHMQWGSFA